MDFGVGLMSFLGGVQERAAEYDEKAQKKADKLAELRAKQYNELLKTELKTAEDAYAADQAKIQAIKSAGGITTPEGQAIAKGYKITEVDKMLAAKKTAGKTWKDAEMPTLGEKPTGEMVTAEDFTTPQTGTTIGKMFEWLSGVESDKQAPEEVKTEIPSISYRRGKSVPLTKEQTSSISQWEQTPKNKYEVLQPIFNAVGKGELVSPKDLRAGRIAAVMGMTPGNAAYNEALNTFETTIKPAFDYSKYGMKIRLATNDKHGKDSGQLVPATPDNIIKDAEIRGKDLYDYLDGLHRTYVQNFESEK